MTVTYTLDRSKVVPLLIGRHEDFLFVSGLAGATRDVTRLTNNGAHVYPLGGVMGAALSMGLGLALAQRSRRIMVVTGDGELLMQVGTLATIAVMNPKNLSVLCVDNGHYMETGGQLSHTSRGSDLEIMARGAGFRSTAVVQNEADIEQGARVLRDHQNASFVLLRTSTAETPRFKRNRDAAESRARFRDALLSAPLR